MSKDITGLADKFEGISATLTNAAYHAQQAFGSTDIKFAQKSLAHFKARVIDKIHVEENRTAFDFGSCAHELCLERSTERFVRGPDVSSKATKEWKECVARHPGKIVLTPDEHTRILGAYDAFCAHPEANRFVSQAKVEHSMFAIDQETGLWIKARPDGFFIKDGKITIFDYKTCISANPRDFSRAIFNYGYDISAAHYMAVAEYVLGMPVDAFYFIAQEKEAPFELMVYKAEPDMLKRAEGIRRSLLNQIKVAIETSEFPGYSRAIQTINIPTWAANLDSDDILGVG